MIVADLPEGEWTPEQAAGAMLDIAVASADQRAEAVFLAIESAMARGEGVNRRASLTPV